MYVCTCTVHTCIDMRYCLILSVCDLLRLTTVVLLVFLQAGDTPLHESASEGHLDCVQFLVLKGADITQRNNVSGNCCLLMVMTLSVCSTDICSLVKFRSTSVLS